MKCSMSKIDLYIELSRNYNDEIAYIANVLVCGRRPKTHLDGLKALLDGGHRIDAVPFESPRDQVFIDGVRCHGGIFLNPGKPVSEYEI